MENLALGFEVMLIGFTVVMVTLYLLYLILLGFSRCCVKPEKPEVKVHNNIQAPPPAVMEEVAAAPVAATMSQHSFGTAPEIIAAITGAISACMELPSTQFEIVSVQPAFSSQNVSSQWAATGIKRLMEKRQDLAMFRRERK